MTDQIEALEDGKLQFARQLYDEFLESRGEDHRETRLLQKYILILTDRANKLQTSSEEFGRAAGI